MARRHGQRAGAHARIFTIVAITAGASAALWPTSRVAACTCGVLLDAPGSLESADVVFLGRVAHLDTAAPTLAERAAGAQPGPDVARFRVQRVYKGDVSAETSINFDYAEAAQCDAVILEGRRFVVFASRTGPSEDWLSYLDDALREHMATPDGRRHRPSVDIAPRWAAYAPGTLTSGGCGMIRHYWFMPYMRAYRAYYAALGRGHAPSAPVSATAAAAAAATALATLGWSPEAVATRFASTGTPSGFATGGRTAPLRQLPTPTPTPAPTPR